MRSNSLPTGTQPSPLRRPPEGARARTARPARSNDSALEAGACAYRVGHDRADHATGRAVVRARAAPGHTHVEACCRRTCAACRRLRAAAPGLPPDRRRRRQRALALSQRPLGAPAAHARLCCTMVYGGPRAAGEMGLRIRAFHRQIRGVAADGHRYHALEPGAYAWVHATLAAGIVLAHERFVRPFDAGECELLWSEWRALGRLLGIRSEDLPADWAGFRAYLEVTVEERLERTAAVEEVLEALARPAPPALTAHSRRLWPVASRQLGHLVRLTTVGLLPPSLRERFGTRWTRAEELRARGAGRGAARGHAADAGVAQKHRPGLSALAPRGARARRGRLATVAPCDWRAGTSTPSSSACRGCCRGSISASPTCVCLQETKLTDDAFDAAARAGARRSRLRARAARRGAVERRRDPLARGPRGRTRGPARRARLPAPRGARAVGHLRRAARALGVRAQRPHAGLRALPLQARLAGSAAASS